MTDWNRLASRVGAIGNISPSVTHLEVDRKVTFLSQENDSLLFLKADELGTAIQFRSLIDLRIARYHSTPLLFPPNLRTLHLGSMDTFHTGQVLPTLPDSIEELKIGPQMQILCDQLPKNLRHLSHWCGDWDKKALRIDAIGLLPASVVQLDLLINTISVSNIPQSVKYLTLRTHHLERNKDNFFMMQDVLAKFPESVQRLTFAGCRNFGLSFDRNIIEEKELQLLSDDLWRLIDPYDCDLEIDEHEESEAESVLDVDDIPLEEIAVNWMTV